MSTNAISELVRNSEDIFEELVSIRRELHKIPEPGYEELKTSRFLAGILDEWGIPLRQGMAKTGIVATIESDPVKKTIALRADIDALPIVEKTGLEFSSTHDGFFHACGHDMHMTCLLGAVKILKDRKDEIPVNVRAIFQPAEEKIPGGASVLIKEGVLKDPEVAAIFGLHVDPFVPTGAISVKTGPMMASTSEFKLRITGKGGHAAKPFACIDPIPIAAQIISSLQTIPSRMIDPLTPIVLSVTKIHAGTVSNIIPEDVFLEGTVRTLDKSTNEKVPEKIETLVKNIVSGYGASYTFEYNRGTGVLVNDEKMTDHVRSVAGKVLGENEVLEYKGTFGGEDFAQYLEHVPGSFFRLGCSADGNGPVSLHNPGFNPDEKAIMCGSAVLAGIALAFEPDA